MPTLVDLPDTPRFPIRTVSARTGIAAGTLRAWERRYHLLTPPRSAGNYRLYSERDIAVLRWVKRRIDDGVSIGRAADEVDAMRRSNRWPAAPPAPVDGPALPGATTLRAGLPAEAYSRRLYDALVAQDEAHAAEILEAAHGDHALGAVCLQIIQPCLVAIGAAWHSGEIRIATEHFASQFLRGHVSALFQAVPNRRRAPRIVVGCAPQERHDIGALMLALFLRRAGYHVDFLGADVHLADLAAHARSSQPDLICLSANSETTALALGRMKALLDALSPAPRFAFGGAAFNQQPDLRARVPGLFLGSDPSQALLRIRDLLPMRPLAAAGAQKSDRSENRDRSANSTIACTRLEDPCVATRRDNPSKTLYSH